MRVSFPTGDGADDARYEGVAYEPLDVWRAVKASRFVWFLAGWMAGIFAVSAVLRLRGWCG